MDTAISPLDVDHLHGDRHRQLRRHAADSFRWIIDANPTEDYAYFGLGLALWRSGDMEGAQEPLAIAAAMRPDQRHYVSALKSVRATLRARRM